MFLARIVFFRLHESPRYLVSAGRPEEALVSLRKISRFNGSELSLYLHDVDNSPMAHPVPAGDADDARTPFLPSVAPAARGDVRLVFDADAEDAADETAPLDGPTVPARRDSPERLHYDSTGSSNTPLDSHTFSTPASELPPRPRPHTFPRSTAGIGSGVAMSPEPKTATLPRPPARPVPQRPAGLTRARRSSLHQAKARLCWALPRWIRRPLWAWLDRLALVFAPEWLKTTLLVWAIWGSMSLGELDLCVFTMWCADDVLMAY